MARLDPARLVGTWRLTGWEIVHEDGAASHPLGPQVEGLLIYGADGWMSANMMTLGRPPLSPGRARGAPEAERAAAFDGFYGYCCRWRVVDAGIEHQVRVALNPAMVGTRQVRAARVSGRTLTVTIEDAVAGRVRRHRLVWRRADPAARRRPGRRPVGE